MNIQTKNLHIRLNQSLRRLRALENAGSATPVSSRTYFMAEKTDGAGITATVTNPPAASQQVLWDAPSISGDGFSYNVSTDELTITSDANGTTGLFNIQINGDGMSNRVQLVVELQVDTGSGWTTLVRSSQYNARDADQNEGATHINGYLAVLNTGDKYRVMCGANLDGGVAVYGTNGCFWSIVAE